MDDYMFHQHVQECEIVTEATSYLEILNYSSYQDPSYNTNEEHRDAATLDEFENFINRQGVFEPPKLKAGVKLLNAIRLVLQKDAQDPDTFTPRHISFSAEYYEKMVRVMRLPFRAIEGTSVVGPFFWSAMDQDDEDPHLQVIFRKSDVRKKGKTRGWELMLSHSFATGITNGYAKGTPSSDLVKCVAHLRACAGQARHPMLLPVIVISHDLSASTDQKQRDARDWIRRLEEAISMREEVMADETYARSKLGLDLDQLNRDLVECHSQVLWKRPQAYLQIIKTMEDAMHRFHTHMLLLPPPPPSNQQDGSDHGSQSDSHSIERHNPQRQLVDGDLDRQHRSMLSRLDFYRAKLNGVEHYAHTTLARLKIQRAALYNVIAQKESKLNLEMAGQQRRLAHASKRDSNSMKTLSLLGAIFLPATLLSSVFGMSFFDFMPQQGEPVVADTLWIFFATSLPLTGLILLVWLVWERKREKAHAEEDDDLEKGIERMEAQIMDTMRRRTLSKARTFEWSGNGKPPGPPLGNDPGSRVLVAKDTLDLAKDRIKDKIREARDKKKEG
ncbi:hypothetical protein PspLS_00466 [Pyricularia sp. CBS 133598]|nr:hypothetical protein PspLS_00466 [Pyricularia sp. CBS 133598]